VKAMRTTQTESVLNSPEAQGTCLGNLGADESSRAS